jgi:SRSO17 transposase
MTAKQMERCRQRLKAYLEEMLTPLGRSERRYWGSVYVRGLLLDGERKSVGAMATRLSEANEQNLQQFLNQSPWAWELVWHAMADRIESSFPPVEAWVIDDTSFPKKGEHSVGVQRQYCGALGKKANCQVAVSLHRTDRSGSSPFGFRLYLPEIWTDDRDRRQRAGVPDQVGFQKKWELALELIDRAFAWGVEKPLVVLADSGYGDNGAFRRGLEQRGLPYAVGITRDVVVWTEPPTYSIPGAPRAPGPKPKRITYGAQRPLSVEEVARQNRLRFRTLTWRKGSRGPMRSCWWAGRVQTAWHWQEGEKPGPELWLLIEWPKEEAAPTKYYLCDLSKEFSLKRLVQMARGRWRVELDYQQMKEELGLDHFEGRSWTGWHHHVTMVMLAHLFLRLEQKRRSSKRKMDPARDAA